LEEKIIKVIKKVLYIILSIILVFIINSNIHFISLNLGFNLFSFYNLISFLFMILLLYLLLEELPELILALFTELLIPLPKKKLKKNVHPQKENLNLCLE
jgi:hypothetical protein